MQLTILYFAALAEQFPPHTLHLTTPISVAELWQQLHHKVPGAHLRVAVNQAYVPWNFIVDQDAEVAFFPPVTGG